MIKTKNILQKKKKKKKKKKVKESIEMCFKIR